MVGAKKENAAEGRAYTKEMLAEASRSHLYGLSPAERENFKLEPKLRAELTKKYEDLGAGAPLNDWDIATVVGDIGSKPVEENQGWSKQVETAKSLYRDAVEFTGDAIESIKGAAESIKEAAESIEKANSDEHEAHKNAAIQRAVDAMERDAIESANVNPETTPSKPNSPKPEEVAQANAGKEQVASNPETNGSKPSTSERAGSQMSDIAASAATTGAAGKASPSTSERAGSQMSDIAASAAITGAAGKASPSTSERAGSQMSDIAASTVAAGATGKASSAAQVAAGSERKNDSKTQSEQQVNVGGGADRSVSSTGGTKSPENEAVHNPSVAVVDGDKAAGVTQGPTAVSKGDSAEKDGQSQSRSADAAEDFRAVSSGDASEKTVSTSTPDVDTTPSKAGAGSKSKQEAKSANNPDLSKYQALAAAVQANGKELTDGVNHNDDKSFNQIAKAAGIQGIDDQDVIKTKDAKSIQEHGAKLADMLKNNASAEDLEKAGADLSNAIESAQNDAVNVGKSGVDPKQLAADNAKEQQGVSKG